MAETMNFFRAQDEARGRTTKLVALLFGAVVLVAVSPFVVGMAVWVYSEDLSWYQPEFFLYTTITRLLPC